MRKRALRTSAFALLIVLFGCDFLPFDNPQQKNAKPKEEKKEAEKKPADKKPAEPTKPASPTIKVEKVPFKVDITAKGMIEASRMSEVALSPEAWSPNSGGVLLVKKALEHGDRVKKGDTIVWLDLERIDHAIQDLENDLRLGELSLKLAEEELPVQKLSTPLDLEAAARSKRMADEDLERYKKHDRENSLKSIEHSLKMSKQYLDYEKEELRQLEKMYKSKDLTEETEEIILKRQRNSVEDAEFMVKQSQIRRDQFVNVDMPRRDIRMNETAQRETLALEKARASLPLLLSQKELGLAKMKYDRAKSADRLRKFKHDREHMTVKAPVDGVVYYGKCQHGSWVTSSMAASKLQRGGMLMADEVFMTIVEPLPVFVRASIEEKDLPSIRPGVEGKMIPAALPDRRIAAKVRDVTAIPVSPGTFEAKIDVDLGAEDKMLVPGMACTVKFVPYKKEAALTLPTTAVFAEELDEDEHFVYLPTKDGKGRKQSVKVGRKSGAKIEILEGLKDGDEVLTEKPKPDTKAKEGSS